MKTFFVFLFCNFTIGWCLAGSNSEVKVYTNSGSIRSASGFVGIDANWSVEVPSLIPGISKSKLKTVQKQINEDAFCKDDFKSGYKTKLDMSLPEHAQVTIFKIAISKCVSKEESFCERSFAFSSELKIDFVSQGYIGYTVKKTGMKGAVVAILM